MKISIQGDLGSGKSTVAKRLSIELGYPCFNAGSIHRDMAKKIGVGINEFYKKIKNDPSVDLDVDKAMGEFGKNNQDCIIEGRVAFHFVPDSIKIFLKCDFKTAAKRISKDQRDSETIASTQEKQIQDLKDRQQCELDRYGKLYQLNHLNPKHFDLVLDTSDITEEEVFQTIMKFIKSK